MTPVPFSAPPSPFLLLTVNGQPIKPHWHDGWLAVDLPTGGQIEVRMRSA